MQCFFPFIRVKVVCLGRGCVGCMVWVPKNAVTCDGQVQPDPTFGKTETDVMLWPPIRHSDWTNPLLKYL